MLTTLPAVANNVSSLLVSANSNIGAGVLYVHTLSQPTKDGSMKGETGRIDRTSRPADLLLWSLVTELVCTDQVLFLLSN